MTPAGTFAEYAGGHAVGTHMPGEIPASIPASFAILASIVIGATGGCVFFDGLEQAATIVIVMNFIE